MTPGEIWRVLLQEAQDRGALLGMTLGCDDDLDSNGNAWSVPVDLEFQVGTTYLQAMETMVEMAVDYRVAPDLTLDVYNRGELGADLTATVALDEGEHLSELKHSTTCAIMNATLMSIHTGSGISNDYTGGAYTGAGDGPSIADNGRLEAYLELGTAPSTDQADRTVSALFDEHATEQVQVTFTPEEREVGGTFYTDERPYTGWQPGDIILVADLFDVLANTTVLSLTCADDPDGGPDPVFRAEGTQNAIGDWITGS
jgi:hypothetical protein